MSKWPCGARSFTLHHPSASSSTLQRAEGRGRGASRVSRQVCYQVGRQVCRAAAAEAAHSMHVAFCSSRHCRLQKLTPPGAPPDHLHLPGAPSRRAVVGPVSLQPLPSLLQHQRIKGAHVVVHCTRAGRTQEGRAAIQACCQLPKLQLHVQSRFWLCRAAAPSPQPSAMQHTRPPLTRGEGERDLLRDIGCTRRLAGRVPQPPAQHFTLKPGSGRLMRQRRLVCLSAAVLGVCTTRGHHGLQRQAQHTTRLTYPVCALAPAGCGAWPGWVDGMMWGAQLRHRRRRLPPPPPGPRRLASCCHCASCLRLPSLSSRR